MNNLLNPATTAADTDYATIYVAIELSKELGDRHPHAACRQDQPAQA